MAIGITEVDVWQAADALLLEGARPTIERVRQKIGRGSPNTVSPHLDTWFRALGPRIKDPSAFNASPALPDPVTQAARQLWETALASARAENEAYAQEARRKHDSERAATARRAEEVQQLHDRLVARERDLEEAILVARQQAQAAETRHAAAESRLVEREKQSFQLQQQVNDLQSAAQLQADRADHARADFVEKLKVAEDRHLAHERRWMTAVDAERATVKRLETDLTRAGRESQEQAKALREALELNRAHERDIKRLTDASDAQVQRFDAQRRQMEVRLDAQIKLLEKRALRAESLLDQNQANGQARERDLQARLEVAQTQMSKLLTQLQDKDAKLNDLNLLLSKRGAMPG